MRAANENQNSPWLMGAGPDLMLVIATPALVIPALFGCLGLGLATAAQLNEWVMTFGAQGHHLPGMMRAYGDRELFQRFRIRFIAAPLLLGGACILCSLYQLQALIFLAFLWGVWHGALQTHGFARIYDAKSGGFDHRTARLDLILVLAAFGTIVLYAPGRMQFILQMLASSGLPLPDPGLLSVLRQSSLVITLLLGAAWVANALATWRQRRGPSLAKVLLLVSSIGTWAWVNLAVSNVLLALPLFEVFHDIQYLTIVWLFNRKRAESAADLGRLNRRIFTGGAMGVGLYVLLCLGYGALPPVGEVGSASYGITSGLLAASQLLHFYYDGFIWKLNHGETRRDLGIRDQSQAQPITVSADLGHSIRWVLLFVLPAGLLVWGESQQGKSPAAIHAQVVKLVPESALAQAMWGQSLEAEARYQQAFKAHVAASRLDPDFRPPRQAITHWLVRWPSSDLPFPAEPDDLHGLLASDARSLAEGLNDRGAAFTKTGDHRSAERAWRLATKVDPAFAMPHFNRAGALARSGAFESALKAVNKGLALSTDPQGRKLRDAILRQLKVGAIKGSHENPSQVDTEREAHHEVENGAKKDP